MYVVCGSGKDWQNGPDLISCIFYFLRLSKYTEKEEKWLQDSIWIFQQNLCCILYWFVFFSFSLVFRFQWGTFIIEFLLLLCNLLKIIFCNGPKLYTMGPFQLSFCVSNAQLKSKLDFEHQDIGLGTERKIYFKFKETLW